MRVRSFSVFMTGLCLSGALASAVPGQAMAQHWDRHWDQHRGDPYRDRGGWHGRGGPGWHDDRHRGPG
ncbi:hypothetical protein, partial [Nguyenibacter vanlangensis]|nr:hypothetical protein [Nguyenibacter vanlangensis]